MEVPKFLSQDKISKIQEKLYIEIEQIISKNDLEFIRGPKDKQDLPDRFLGLLRKFKDLEKVTSQDIVALINQRKAERAQRNRPYTPVQVLVDIKDSSGQDAIVNEKKFSVSNGHGVISVYTHSKPETQPKRDAKMIALVFHGHAVSHEDSVGYDSLKPDGSKSEIVAYEGDKKAFAFLVPEGTSLSRAENPEVLLKKYQNSASILTLNREQFTDSTESRSYCPNHTIYPHAKDFEGDKGENDRRLLGGFLSSCDVAIYDDSTGDGHLNTGRFHLKDVVESNVFDDYDVILLLGCRTPFSAEGDIKTTEYIPDGKLYSHKGEFEPD